ncbi:MAG TPA: AAA family ATPase, partial [Thermoanaerobaculia bacterium]|nr:AAA family ATPase [Thermoanaerobaculia bacterium]
KGRKATLLGADGETPLDGSRLDRCLQGIDEALFSSLFGLDHAALVEGGEELLAQKGDVGQALFAAGLGTRNLRQVLERLDAEAEALFLARGSKPRINQGIAVYREAKRASADLSLSGREWEGKHRELEKRREESAGLAGELAVRKAERNRLQRIRRVQPRLGERRDLRLRLAELGEVAPLPPGFAESRRETRETLRAAVEAGIRAETELAELRQEAAALTVSRAVLDQAETIERLHQGVELYSKGITDRSRLLGERGELYAQAEQLLDDLRPGLVVAEAEALRPVLGRWRRIQELGNQRQALWNGGTQARAEAAEAEKALAAARAAFAALPVPRDPTALGRRLDAARKTGDLDRGIAAAAGALVGAEEQLHLDLGRLGLWQGTPAALAALPVPGEESLRRFADGFEALASRRRTLADQLRTVRAELAEVERRLDEIRRAGAVPTEEEMLAARARRDLGWDSLRRAWLAGEEVAADPAGYERSVAEADELADRLRREAGRVQEQAQLLARRDQLRRAAEELAADEARAAAAGETLAEEWRALWQPCGIAPLPPREMHPAWTHRHEQLRARVEALRGERREVDTLRATRAGHRAALVHELEALGDTGPAGETLEPILAQAEERVRHLERETAERVRLTAAVRAATARLAA